MVSMYSIVGQHKALPLLARVSGKNTRLQRFAYADLPQLGADTLLSHLRVIPPCF